MGRTKKNAVSSTSRKDLVPDIPEEKIVDEEQRKFWKEAHLMMANKTAIRIPTRIYPELHVKNFVPKKGWLCVPTAVYLEQDVDDRKWLVALDCMIKSAGQRGKRYTIWYIDARDWKTNEAWAFATDQGEMEPWVAPPPNDDDDEEGNNNSDDNSSGEGESELVAANHEVVNGVVANPAGQNNTMDRLKRSRSHAAAVLEKVQTARAEMQAVLDAKAARLLQAKEMTTQLAKTEPFYHPHG